MPSGPFRLYIDGFNLCFGLLDAGLAKFKWLDLVELGRSIGDGRTLDSVRYYTADIRRPADSRARQVNFIEALRARYPQLLQVREGFMQWEPWVCTNCHQTSERRTEKQTDVNLAVDLVRDAYEGEYECAMVMSGDSDLVAAIDTVINLGKTVIVAFPPERKSDHLRRVAARSGGSFDVSKGKIRRAQLPDRISSTNRDHVYVRPSAWS